MKRLLVLCMMLLIVLPLSACGGSTDVNDSTSKNSKETTKATVSIENTTESDEATETTTEKTTEKVTESEKSTEKDTENDKPTENLPEEEKPAEENNSSNENNLNNAPVNEDTKRVFVDTEYYTLTTPESWEDDCVYEIHRGENNIYSLVFYDKASHEEIGGGKLFTVRLLAEGQEYTQYPDYDVLGSIKVDGAGLNAIVIYPTDVQFGPNTAESYREHQNEVDDVVATITFKDGYDFSYQPL